jgi:pimeloyl-ACP methyl ester carboxylesterase
VRDGVSVLRYLLDNFKEIDQSNVYLAGHSEGGWTISAMYPLLLESGIRPKGMVFLCGFGVTIKDSMLFQADQVALAAEKATGLTGWILQSLAVGRNSRKNALEHINFTLSTTTDSVNTSWFTKINAKWIREAVTYNPTENWAQIESRVLVISGDKDVQVPCFIHDDAPNLLSKASSVQFLTIQNMCHVLKIQKTEASILTKNWDYLQLVTKPLAPELLMAIQSFLSTKDL